MGNRNTSLILVTICVVAAVSTIAYSLDKIFFFTKLPQNSVDLPQEKAIDKILVTRIQEHLSAFGHGLGAIDGIIGQQTRRAIIHYQEANGLAPDGVPSAALLVRMQTQAATGIRIDATARAELVERYHGQWLKIIEGGAYIHPSVDKDMLIGLVASIWTSGYKCDSVSHIYVGNVTAFVECNRRVLKYTIATSREGWPIARPMP